MSSGSKRNRKTNRSRDKSSESRGRRRLQFTSAPLEGKTFFLHVQSASKARELERKLKELGGVVEKFLSKELSCVITDQKKPGTTNLTLSGNRGLTRAEAILQKSVKQQKQPTKSTDVLTNAEKWGIQVKPVEQVLKWFEGQTKRQAASRQPTGRVCSLRGAFLKVEDHSRQYRPLVKELNMWPRLNLDAPPGFSPFDEPVSMRTRSRSSSKSPQRRTKRAVGKRSTGSADKKGYCELCYAHYAGMEGHINSRQHTLVASRKDTYAELDRLISRGKTLKEFEAEMRKKTSAEASNTTGKSRSRSRSSVIVKSTPQKRKIIPGTSTSPRRRKTLKSQPSTPPPGQRTPSRQSETSSPARTRPNSAQKVKKTVTPIKIVRFQNDQYSVVKSRAKKRRRDEADVEASHNKSKRKKTDRYSIVESTPMRIRLRRSTRSGSKGASGSLFVNLPVFVKTPNGRSP